MYPIDDEWSAAMDAQCAEGRIGAKLAFVRVGFPYFFSETAFEYIVDAIHLLADHAWKLLPLYRFDPDTGLWHHASGARPRLTLHDVSFAAEPERPRASAPESVLARQLEQARQIIGDVEAAPPAAATDPELTPEFERHRWFPLPGESLARLLA